MNSQTEMTEPLFFETSTESETFETENVLPPTEPDIEVMCHIRDILDSGFPEENKGDPSFKIVHKHVVEYISRNCRHQYIKDWIDLDPDRGGKMVEYCEMCYTIKP